MAFPVLPYDLHITRRKPWFNHDSAGPILAREWKRIAATDPAASTAKWDDGQIVVTNPKRSLIRKMEKWAQALNAHVIGDYGEIYKTGVPIPETVYIPPAPRPIPKGPFPRPPPLQPLRIPTGWMIHYNDLKQLDPKDARKKDFHYFREDLLQIKNSYCNRLLDIGWYGGNYSRFHQGAFTLNVHEGDFHGPRLLRYTTRNLARLVARFELAIRQIESGKL